MDSAQVGVYVAPIYARRAWWLRIGQNTPTTKYPDGDPQKFLASGNGSVVEACGLVCRVLCFFSGTLRRTWAMWASRSW